MFSTLLTSYLLILRYPSTLPSTQPNLNSTLLNSIFRSDQVFPGLSLFRSGKRLSTALDVPGVRAAGWTPLAVTGTLTSSSERDRNRNQAKLSQQLKTLFDRVRLSEYAWAFGDAADGTAVATGTGAGSGGGGRGRVRFDYGYLKSSNSRTD